MLVLISARQNTATFTVLPLLLIDDIEMCVNSSEFTNLVVHYYKPCPSTVRNSTVLNVRSIKMCLSMQIS